MTKQELAYSTIRGRILDGTYGPGTRLVIDQLAPDIGVSALPVREAIRRLEAEGLVVFRANAGAHVAPADPILFEESLTVLAILEGHATALAAPRLDGDDLARLSELTERMERAFERDEPLEFGRLNHEFHALIHERCGNAILQQLLGDVGGRLDAIRQTVFVQIPYRGGESVAEHRQLIRLLSKPASVEAIETAAREHKLETVRSFRAWNAQQPS